VTVTTLFHCSDLHFGHPAVPEQYEAIEALIRTGSTTSSRSRATSRSGRAPVSSSAPRIHPPGEKVAVTIVVPGNHDVAWWLAPLGFGDAKRMFAKYRTYISPDLEPVLRIAGATFVGLNTSQGVSRHTLTWNMRDISIIGHLNRGQIERARVEFEKSRAGDARVIVMHHNPVKGELSQRHGLKNTQRILGAFAEMAWIWSCAGTTTRRRCTTSNTRSGARSSRHPDDQQPIAGRAARRR
jgi:3',5'-cyclic AMP phosphodiesterase CpdA